VGISRILFVRVLTLCTYCCCVLRPRSCRLYLLLEQPRIPNYCAVLLQRTSRTQLCSW